MRTNRCIVCGKEFESPYIRSYCDKCTYDRCHKRPPAKSANTEKREKMPKMDNLSKDAFMARLNGCSYGKYMVQKGKKND